MAFTKDKIGYRVANENDIADGKTCINCVWHHEFGGRYFCEYLGFSPRDEIEMKGTCDRVELGK